MSMSKSDLMETGTTFTDMDSVSNVQSNAQQPIYVMVQPSKTPDSEHFAKNYPPKIVRGLAIAQIAICAVALISEVRASLRRLG